MAGKSALPLLLIGGAAVAMASKKKKRKSSSSSSDGGGAGYDDPYGGGGESPLDPYGGSDTGFPKPKPTPASNIPAGDPPNPAGGGQWGDYDHGFWDSAAKIKEIFAQLGYSVPDRDTMNDPGADGKLGGNDDIRNLEVQRFQKEYNAVSRSKTLANNMGGLKPDGFVGPKTLNGLKFVLDSLGGKTWSDAKATAASKGFKP